MLSWMERRVWLGVGLPVALVFFLGLREIGTADFWWQWATGRYVLENGIPHVDPWLTTPEPRPWIEMRWAYCAGLYWSVENAGAWLAIVVAALLYAVGVGLTLIAGGRAPAAWLAGVGVAAATVMGRRLVVRPEAFTLVFLGLLLFLIVRVRQGQLSPKWALVWIALIQVVWANTHALFALATAVCSIWLVVELFERSDRRLVALIAVIITLAGSFATPYGLTGALFPFTLLGELHAGAYRNNILELRTPFAFGISPSLFAHMAMAVAVAVFGAKRRGDAFLLFVCAATFYLSITVVRNAPLFALAACAYISTCDLKPSRAPLWVAGIASALIAGSFALGTWTFEDRLGFKIAEHRYPIVSARAIKGTQGKVFNTLIEGSLLIAQRDKAYCDPRLEVLPQERFREMLAISRLERPLPEDFATVFLSIDSPLAAALVRDGGWRLAGFDPVGISMVREPGAVISRERLKELALKALPKNPPSFSWFRKAASPTPYRRLAVFFRNLGEDETADYLIAEARRIYPTR